MRFIKQEHEKFNQKDYNSFILGADIGGTNTTLGVFGVQNNFPTLLISFHFKTNKLKSLHYAVNDVLFYIKKSFGISITKACFGVAGVVSYKRDSAIVTNAGLSMGKKLILGKTKLKNALIINDFEAVGYGINIFDKKDISIIKKAQKIPKAPIIVIGAGTGLGKATLVYDEHSKFYIPLPSEAGHSDFSAQSQLEFELAAFIKKHKNIKENVSYEHVISGKGLENIYLFLRKSRKFRETIAAKEIDKSNNKPELISKYRKTDKLCKEAFEIFKNAYAKFARNSALDALPWGGVYIAGGIAPKNKDIFDNNFIKVFQQSHKMTKVLKKIPIYLISAHHNPGLLGAGFAGAKFLMSF